MKKVIGILTLVIFFCAACHKTDEQVSPQIQLSEDVAAIDNYLAANGITTALKDSSGVRYTIVFVGKGVKPVLSGKVTLQVRGRFLSTGTIYTQDSVPSTYNMTDLLAALQILVPKFPKGSAFTAYIPSGLAYGTAGSLDGTVPPNTNLILDVDIFDDDAQLVKDKALIDQHLKDSSIVALKDSSGLRYVLEKAGTGQKPVATSNVTVRYAGFTMNDGKVFTHPTTVQVLTVANLIPAWKIVLPLIQSGSKIKLYAPSGLAYGPFGTADGTIKPNTNLIFTIELVSVD